MNSIKYITCALALIISSVVTTTHAIERYHTAKMKYFNKGNYKACVAVYWNDSNGKKQNIDWDAKKETPMIGSNYCLNQGQSTTVDFAKIESWTKNSTHRVLREGDEIWLRIEIFGGDNKNCHKDNPKFIYDPDGTKAEMKTSGTTLNNNRCKITQKK